MSTFLPNLKIFSATGPIKSFGKGLVTGSMSEAAGEGSKWLLDQLWPEKGKCGVDKIPADPVLFTGSVFFTGAGAMMQNVVESPALDPKVTTTVLKSRVTTHSLPYLFVWEVIKLDNSVPIIWNTTKLQLPPSNRCCGCE